MSSRHERVDWKTPGKDSSLDEPASVEPVETEAAAPAEARNRAGIENDLSIEHGRLEVGDRSASELEDGLGRKPRAVWRRPLGRADRGQPRAARMGGDLHPEEAQRRAAPPVRKAARLPLGHRAAAAAAGGFVHGARLNPRRDEIRRRMAKRSVVVAR